MLTGDDVMILGFTISGPAGKQMPVVIRASFASLIPFGIPNALANPVLTVVRSSDQTVIATNDNWGDDLLGRRLAQIGYQPGSNLESAVLMFLAPGAYTAIVSGSNGGTGVAIAEVFAY